MIFDKDFCVIDISVYSDTWSLENGLIGVYLFCNNTLLYARGFCAFIYFDLLFRKPDLITFVCLSFLDFFYVNSIFM